MAFELKKSDIFKCFNFKLPVRVNVESAFDLIKSKVEIDEDKEESLKKKLKLFEAKSKNLWKNASYNKKSFESRHGKWLNGNFDIEEFIRVEDKAGPSTSTGRRPGRPTKSWKDLSDRSKRRRLESLTSDATLDPTTKALLLARRTAHYQKNQNLATLLGLIAKRQKDSLHIYRCLKSKKKVTGEEALATYLNFDMSKSQFEEYRRYFTRSGIKYPTYSDVVKLKNKTNKVANHQGDSDD